MTRRSFTPALALCLVASATVAAVLAIYPRPGSATQWVAGALALALAVLSAWRALAGLTLLAALLPLLNNTLVTGPLGGAPAAALLGLSYVAGAALYHRPGAGRRRANATEDPAIAAAQASNTGDAFDAALLIFAVYGACSALLTMLRYTGFTLFSSAPHYYWINTWQESAWDACRSVALQGVVWIAGPLTCLCARRTLAGEARRLRIMLGGLAVGLALAVAFAGWQSAGRLEVGAFEHFSGRQRVSGSFTEANAAGIFACFAVALLVALFMGTRQRLARLALGLLVLALLWLVAASGSRTGLLGLPLLLLALPWLPPWSRPRLKRALLIGAGAALLAVLAIVAALHAHPEQLPTALQRLASAVQSAAAHGPLALARYERLRAWGEGWRMVQHHPLAGLGLGSYFYELPTLLYFELDQLRYRDNSNNFYLQAWAELGLPGLLLALGLGLAVLRTVVRRLRTGESGPELRALAALTAITPILWLTGPHERSPELQVLLGLLAAAAVPSRWPLPAAMPAAMPATWCTQRGRHLATAAALLALAGLAGQGWLARGALSIPALSQRYQFAQAWGLAKPSPLPDGRWLTWTGRKAELTYHHYYRWLQFQVQCFHPDMEKKQVKVDVLLDGVKVHTLRFSKMGELQSTLLAVPDRTYRLELRVNRVWIPRRHDPHNGDARELGVLMTIPEFFGPRDPANDFIHAPLNPPAGVQIFSSQ